MANIIAQLDASDVYETGTLTKKEIVTDPVEWSWFRLRSASTFLVVSYHVLVPGGAAHPVDVRIHTSLSWIKEPLEDHVDELVPDFTVTQGIANKVRDHKNEPCRSVFLGVRSPGGASEVMVHLLGTK